VALSEAVARQVLVRPLPPAERCRAALPALGTQPRPIAVVKVQAVEGVCGAGHRPGQRFVLTNRTPEGMCAAAYLALYARARALQAQLAAGQADPHTFELSCPEHGIVTFRIEPVVPVPHHSPARRRASRRLSAQ